MFDMAFQSVWYSTGLPEKLVKTIDEELFSEFKDSMEVSSLYKGEVNKETRNSSNAWIPSGHWLPGFLWHYVSLANRSNFLYDIDCIDMGRDRMISYIVDSNEASKNLYIKLGWKRVADADWIGFASRKPKYDKSI